MKKILAAFFIIAFCFSLCACSLVPEAEVVYVQAEELSDETQPSVENTVSQADAADTQAAETLCAILEDMYSDCRPGTAGSSLRLAAFSARMLDWYELHGSVGAISKASAAFSSAHDDYAAVDDSSEIASGFPAILADAWRCAADMSFPGGDAILGDAGYTRSTEWDPLRTEVFFTQLFAALGLDEPASIKLYFGRVSPVRYPAAANEASLMAALRSAGVIGYDVQIAAFIHDGDHLALDLSSEIIHMLNSLDSDGEHFALGCIVYTFLDAYEADNITLTVDGKALATERAVYDFAIKRSDI